MKRHFFLLTFPLLLILINCHTNESLENEENPPPIVEDPITVPTTNTVGVTIRNKGITEGYTLFTPSKSKETYLINNCGEVINQWTSQYLSGKSVFLLENGHLLRAGEIPNDDIKIGGIGGAIELFDWNNNIVWSTEYSSASYSHHHDAISLPNGNILLLVATRKTKADCLEAGRNPDTLEDEELYNEQIIEIEMIGSDQFNIVWEWNIWDHLIQDFDSSKENYGNIRENPQLMDLNFIGRSENKADWLHANSIQYNEELDQIVISFQGTSEIFIIDHSTTTEEAASHSGGSRGKGGDILFRWGNPQAYQLGSEENRTLYGQHFPHWIPTTYPDGGKLIIFNNGLERAGDFSSVDIISPPLQTNGTYLFNSGEPYAPLKPDWTYTSTSFFSEIISGAQRLENGNTLICEGQRGRIFEINANKEIVWQYINPESGSGILTQGDQGTDNAVFRALKYPKDYAAFDDRDLTPGAPIELNPNIGNCQ